MTAPRLPIDAFLSHDQSRDTRRFFHDPTALGQGVRVAILDSGIDASYLRDKYGGEGLYGRVAGGGVFHSGNNEPMPYEGKQSSPHGTIVADILLSVAPHVEIYSADIIGPSGQPDLDRLLKALSYCINQWRCKVVNLSLGIGEYRLGRIVDRYQFQRAVEEAYYQDVVIVAAAHNDHPYSKSFPAQFSPSLISVGKSWNDTQPLIRYELTEQIEFQACGHGVAVQDGLGSATSWACPRVAGLIARIISLYPHLKPFEIKTLLYWYSRNLGH